MVLIYGETNQNSNKAARIYALRFLNRRHPVPRTFVNAIQRLRDNEQLQRQHVLDEGPGRPLRVLNREEEILNIAAENPSLSTRSIGRQLNFSHSVVWRTLRADGQHPFHLQKQQQLVVEDYPPRLNFCEWLIQRYEENENFLKDILWTDESIFTRNGIFNQHKEHIWSEENPHATRTRYIQQRFSLNMWGGILNGHLLGFHELPNTMNANDYLRFLENDLAGMLDDIPLALYARMYIMHDGASVHYGRNVRAYLNDFPQRWIGRLAANDNGIRWPARSPDLNPMDFYVWGHLNHLVYGARPMPANVEELRQRIQHASVIINNQQTLNNCLGSLIRRARLSIAQGGGHFEHLL